MSRISVTHITDPGCPWAYSGLPAITALRWRYGDQLRWRTAMIGLAETPEEYESRGYSPALMAQAPLYFGRFGMPFALGPRTRIVATGRACRAVAAARLEREDLGYLALRALHFAWFTTTLLLDEEEAIGAALAGQPELDAEAIVARLDAPEVEEAYARDRSQARAAAGSPSSLQERTDEIGDGGERYTAPTLIFEADGARLEAGGHQPLEAYDVLVANLAPDLRLEPPPDGPAAVLERLPYGLTTREVATVLAPRNEPPDDGAAAAALLSLVAEGRASRIPLGGDALWRPAPGS